MFLKMKTVATAAAIAGLFAAGGAATAQAGTVVVTSGGSVTASAASARLVVNNAVALNCAGVASPATPGASATATVANGTYTGAAPLTVSSNVGIAFSGCTVAGIPFTVSCPATATLRVTGNTVAGTTPGLIDMISCTVSVPAIGCTALVTGSVRSSYNNSGSLTVFAANQALTVSGSTCTNVIPNGTGKYGSTVAGQPNAVGDITYALGAVKPQLASSGF